MLLFSEDYSSVSDLYLQAVRLSPPGQIDADVQVNRHIVTIT